MTLAGDVSSHSLVEIHRRFRGAYFLQHKASDYVALETNQKDVFFRLNLSCTGNGHVLLVAFHLEALGPSVASISLFHSTRCNRPEGTFFCTSNCDDLKSHESAKFC
jgi:hypothetical protein